MKLKTRTEIKIDYVANDGRIFENEQDCLDYESALSNALAIMETIETAPELEGCFPPSGNEVTTDHSFFWFLPKTDKEIEALNVYYNADNFDRIGRDAINQWICVELDYSEAYFGYTPLSDCAEHIKNLFGKMGYDVSFRKTSDVSAPEPVKCSAYHTEYGKPECWGTKEREQCMCGGDCSKCDFYPEKRKSTPPCAHDNAEILRAAMSWESESVADSSDLLEIFRDHWGISNEELKEFGYEYLLDLESGENK